MEEIDDNIHSYENLYIVEVWEISYSNPIYIYLILISSEVLQIVWRIDRKPIKILKFSNI